MNATTSGSNECLCHAAASGPVQGSPVARVLLLPLVAYRKLISPALPRRCRYEPTCSRYAEDAVREFGFARGSVLAVWRLLRCNPFSRGGFDPVVAQNIFSSRNEGR